MDFFTVKVREAKEYLEIYPNFKVCRSQDLLVRGGAFYGIWDEAEGMWSTDAYSVARLVDDELRGYSKRLSEQEDRNVSVRYMSDFSSKSWTEFNKYLKSVPDSKAQLDTKLTFSNEIIRKEDYVSKKLSYPLENGSHEAFDELIETLYDEDERKKLEWAIGSIVSGDSRDIQKFIVLYGPAGAGKSTVLHIIEKLFESYCVNFEAKALTSTSNRFSLEMFRSNPLVAIQHDGDLSKIEDNTKLNSIVSHENMVVDEKFKASYSSRMNCFLFMGTNQPVKITDAKSGILRRLIDVHPSGRKLPFSRYSMLMGKVNFELGAIASYCLSVYRELGQEYYDSYKPLDMMYKTNLFFNFVEDSYPIFKRDDMVTLKAAYSMYKEYCTDSGNDYRLPMYKFREELKNYFSNFDTEGRVDGKHVRSLYSGFLAYKIDKPDSESIEEKNTPQIVLESLSSIFDSMCKDCFAQYATNDDKPITSWDNVTTRLSDLDTSKVHYVRVPENHIVIDFDLKDDNGDKSLELNLEAASKWPKTYCETSKSGKGIHLHYIYSGDPKKLSRVYSEGIEIKVFTGKSSLRRKLVKCNDEPVAIISSGLPLKEEKKMINHNAVMSERSLRDLIKRNLNKEIHPGTKSSVDFIYKILDDAYKSDLKYDISDMRPSILAFANNSSHHSDYCLDLVSKMHFSSEKSSDNIEDYSSDELIFFDVEVFQNLFVIVWKAAGKNPVKMINPTPVEVGELFNFKLVGFNCRRYDNHILYARYLGYSLSELYELSQRIINNSRNGLFREAYNISYTDVYDFSSKKQSLKKFEIELGIHHQELGLKWDEPVPEDLWEKVADYCINDVIATEAVFNARKQDFVAREILADLSGLSVNDTTQQHTAKILFGDDPNPQDKFVYTDLSEVFPGYVFKNGKSMYKGENPSEGGYVYAEPGAYTNVALLDIASMHPTSLIELNLFGPYTENFVAIKDARIAIKRKDFDSARKMLGGKLSKYLVDEDDSEALAYALKIAINIVYGLTSAKFENKFKDPRNIDNIVAKRGALFMINLKEEVQNRGFTVAHIKTDSIKIPNATSEIIEFVMEYGKKYGYTFEHEATYSKMCLVNDAVYIAKYANGKNAEKWTATGAQFQHPYVFKTLFSKEKIEFEDLCETKSVTSAIYLDMNEDLPDVSEYEEEMSRREYNSKPENNIKKRLNPNFEKFGNENLRRLISSGHNYKFVGKAGSFCPIKSGRGGGILVREKDGKYYAVTGSKGYRWLESEMVRDLGIEDAIDDTYQKNLVDQAVTSISKYCDFEWFAYDKPEPLPWED